MISARFRLSYGPFFAKLELVFRQVPNHLWEALVDGEDGAVGGWVVGGGSMHHLKVIRMMGQEVTEEAYIVVLL